MSIKQRTVLQQTFVTGAKPTQQDFTDWLDSYRHMEDKLLPATAPAAPSDGDIWYDAVAARFKGVRAGVTQSFLMDNDALLNQNATAQNANAKITGSYTGSGFYTNGWWYEGLYLTNFGHIYGITDIMLYEAAAGITHQFRINGAPVAGMDWKGLSVNGRILLSEQGGDTTPGEPITGGILFNSVEQRFRGRINGPYYNFVMEGLPMNITSIQNFPDWNSAAISGLPAGRVFRVGNQLGIM